MREKERERTSNGALYFFALSRQNNPSPTFSPYSCSSTTLSLSLSSSFSFHFSLATTPSLPFPCPYTFYSCPQIGSLLPSLYSAGFASYHIRGHLLPHRPRKNPFHTRASNGISLTLNVRLDFLQRYGRNQTIWRFPGACKSTWHF